MLRMIVLAFLVVGLLAPNTVSAADCTFQLGFKALRDMIPAIVGDCRVNEHHNPENGDGLQETTGVNNQGGLMVWRKADNWTAYTDGCQTWVNGPNGLQQRLNTERFAWEPNPERLPIAGPRTPAALPPPVEGPRTLRQALDAGLIQAEFEGRGASSGDSILLRVRNLTAGPLDLSIPPGTVLKSGGAGFQDMIVQEIRGIPGSNNSFRPAGSISLAAQASETYLLAAYCLNFERDNPGPQTRFTLGGAEFPDAQKLMAILSQIPREQRTIPAVQAAVWAITDNVTREHLQDKFTVSDADILAARQLLERAGVNAASRRLFSGG